MPIDQITSASLASGVPTRAQLPAGCILQVAQVVKTDTWTTSSTTMTDVTGLSLTITPTSVNSKILVLVDVHIGYSVYAGVFYLLRNGVKIYAGDGGLSRCGLFSNAYAPSNTQYMLLPLTATFLDSPASTTAVTYKIQGSSYLNGSNTYVNRTAENINEPTRDGLTASSITLMEVAA